MFNSKGKHPFTRSPIPILNPPKKKPWPFAQLKKRLVNKSFSSFCRLRLPENDAN